MKANPARAGFHTWGIECGPENNLVIVDGGRYLKLFYRLIWIAVASP